MEETLKNHFKYIIIAVSLIICSIIIWWSLLYIQYNKSQSIERQVSEKTLLEREQYKSKRAKECWEIFYTEQKRRNNVLYYEYDKTIDECIITYKRYDDKICKPKDTECLGNATFTKSI